MGAGFKSMFGGELQGMTKNLATEHRLEARTHLGKGIPGAHGQPEDLTADALDLPAPGKSFVVTTSMLWPPCTSLA